MKEYIPSTILLLIVCCLEIGAGLDTNNFLYAIFIMLGFISWQIPNKSK